MTTEVKKIKTDEYNTEECVIVPPVDIYETDNDFVIKADMPGVDKGSIDVIAVPVATPDVCST